MIDLNCITDTSLTNRFVVQFRLDSDVLVIPVSVTTVLSSCAEDLDNVLSQPKAMPDICAILFYCRWHVYIFLRDLHFIGVLVDCGRAGEIGRVWYAYSLK